MIKVRGFKKTFLVGLRRRRVEAAIDIGFEVERGEIFGFLGPNGSGKTTTIKAMLGLIRPTAGSFELCGHPQDSFAWRHKLGYMPEHPTFYDFLTGHELVTWFGQLAGLGRHEAERQAARHLERVGLGHALQRRIRGYSKGMLQRAGLAQTLMGSPELLVLDEPMTGLDPIGRRDIRDLLLELKAEGRTIFYSTHILPDVEMTCDRVSIVHRGRTKRTGRLSDILEETTRGVELVVEELPAELLARLQREHPKATLHEGRFSLLIADRAEASRLAAELLAAGGRLVRFEAHRDNLEAIFVRALGEAVVEGSGA